MIQRLSSLVIAFLMLSACNNSNNQDKKQGGLGASGWPEYSVGPLRGRILGSDFQVAQAVARSFGNTDSKISISFLSEKTELPCDTFAFSSKPQASMGLTKSYQVMEYVTDLSDIQNGEVKRPVVFTWPAQTDINLVADKTKIKITEITATGFEAQIFAEATSENGDISTINGQVSVVDCTR